MPFTSLASGSWSEFQIQHFQMPVLREPPQKSLQICPTDIPKIAKQVGKIVLSADEMWPPQINVFHCPKFRPMTRWGPYCYGLPIPNVVYGYTRKLLFFRIFAKVHFRSSAFLNSQKCVFTKMHFRKMRFRRNAFSQKCVFTEMHFRNSQECIFTKNAFW